MHVLRRDDFKQRIALSRDAPHLPRRLHDALSVYMSGIHDGIHAIPHGIHAMPHGIRAMPHESAQCPTEFARSLMEST